VVEPATGEELVISHAAVSLTRSTGNISIQTLNEVYNAALNNALNKFLLNEEEVGILNANLKRFSEKPVETPDASVEPAPAAAVPAVQDTVTKPAPVPAASAPIAQDSAALQSKE